MKALVTFDLPFPDDGDDLERLLEKAREVGLPMLAVVLNVEPSFDGAPADGMTSEMMGGLQLGQMIGDLEHELNTLTPGGVRKIGARVLGDTDAEAQT